MRRYIRNFVNTMVFVIIKLTDFVEKKMLFVILWFLLSLTLSISYLFILLFHSISHLLFLFVLLSFFLSHIIFLSRYLFFTQPLFIFISLSPIHSHYPSFCSLFLLYVLFFLFPLFSFSFFLFFLLFLFFHS